MNAAFKKEILKQLNKTINDLEVLLKTEGSITDLTELPRSFAESTHGYLAFLQRCKEQIETDQVVRRFPSPRVSYARPLIFPEED